MLKRICVACWIATLAFGVSAEGDVLSGRWVSEGGDVAVVLRSDTIDAGAALELDLPEYGIVGTPLKAPVETDGVLSIESDDRDFVVSFELRPEADKLTGTWNLRGRTADLTLVRADEALPFTVEKVSYQNGDTTLVAHLLLPRTSGPHPALVYFHGSGDNKRSHYWGDASYFAARGTAVLVPDKRGNHDSEGNWKDVGFEALAHDGIAGLRHLQSRDDIRADRIGVIGVSQACWIMPLAATLCPDIAFIVAISGAAVTVEEEGYYDFEWRLREAGYDEAIRKQALALVALDNDVTRGKADMADLVAQIKLVRKEPWYKAMEFHPAPHGVADRDFYGRIIDHDPMPLWREVKVPVLFIYGMADESVDAARSIGLLQPLLDDPARDFSIQTFEGANHGIRVPGLAPEGVPLTKRAPGFHESISAWLVKHDAAQP